MVLLFLNVIVFLSYLYNVYTDKENNLSPLKRILYPYMAFSLYNYVVICILAMMIFVGFPHQLNPIPNTDPLLVGHKDWNMICYFPYYLSISQNYNFISLFGIPALTGLCHEPQAFMFLSTPAILFSLAYITNKKAIIVITIVFLFVLFETLSTTAFLCVAVLLLLEILWHSKGRNLLPIAVGLLLVWFTMDFIANTEIGRLTQAQLKYKLVGEGSGSGEVSISMINYLFSNTELLGEGNRPSEYGIDVGMYAHAGVITMVLDVIVYAFMAISSIKAFMSNERAIHYLGMGCLYYVLHGTKVSYLMVSYPYFMFVFFLAFILDKQKHSKSLMHLPSQKYSVWRIRKDSCKV